MIVMFGWVKDARQVETGLKCWCYRCQRLRGWELWKETEWVSFFMVKAIPFMSKFHLVCSACRDALAIDAGAARQLATPAALPAIVQQVETLQLASKSEVQRGFLLSQRAQRETPG